MYKVYGNQKGTEVIIAIPALGERKEMFLPLVKTMPQYKWLLFDLPGSNQQQLDDYSIPSFCQYIKETIAQLHMSQAHFVGSSLGAWIIQAFAAAYPENVRSLVLLDGGHYFLAERQEKHEDVELPSAIADFTDIQEAIHDLTYSMPNLDASSYTHFERYFQHNYILLSDGYAHHCNTTAYNALSKELMDVDYCIHTNTIPMLLVIAGASADAISLEKAAIFDNKQTLGKVVYIEHGQHYLPLTNTIAVAKALRDFL